MSIKASLTSSIKAARKRGKVWVRLLDFARVAGTSEGRGVLWTKAVHRADVHQTTPYTCEERYPELFDLVAALKPEPQRILSFGCSTGEELTSLRSRFPNADIVGAEINPRSRNIATRRLAQDPRTAVVHPRSLGGPFDIIFALAVLQREPHKIAEMEVQDLSPYYPHARFDAAVRELGKMLRVGGLLCVTNAQYRIEDSSVSCWLEPITRSPPMDEPLFSPDGRILSHCVARTIFRKVRA